MKILIGVFTGMLLGGSGVWAFHDQRPFDNYQSPVTPLAQPSTSQNTHWTDDLNRNSRLAAPCRP
jgi:hypothetical protein